MNPDFCVRQCPFLAKVAEQNGLEYARGIAVDPTLSAGHQLPQGDINSKTAATFSLFHGPEGIVPLVQKPKTAGGCPFHAQRAAAPQSSAEQASSSKPLTRPLPLATISLSFGSGPNFGDFLRNKINKQGSGSRRPNSHRQHPQQPASSSSSQAPNGPGSSQHPASNPSNPGSFKPQRPLTDPTGSGLGTSGSGLGPSQRGFGPGYGAQPPSASSVSTAHPTASPTGGPSNGSISSSRGWSTVSSNSSTGSISSSTGGSRGLGSSSSSPSSFKASSTSRANGRWGSAPAQNPKGHSGARGPGGVGGSRVADGSASANGPAPACPLRKWLGPVAGLVFNEYDKIVCPPAIVAARAALSRTAAVQQLRPQKLPVKLVAVAAVAAASNMPCGAVREHFEKFSVGWFIAIHATIPFVAMLRKAVMMPKYAMLVTFGAAILGQVIGSRLERARLQQLQQQGLTDPLLVLTKPSSWMEAPAAAVPAPVGIAAGQDGSSSNSSAPARGAGWQQKLIAGVQAGLDGGEKAAAAAARVCSTEVVGLGSCLPRLPTVRE